MATLAVPRLALLRRARALEVFTVAWNSLEGAIAVGLGILAGSIALVGFGIDSVIETSSGVILLWRLQVRRDAEEAEAAERRALRLVGASLLILALYVAGDALLSIPNPTSAMLPARIPSPTAMAPSRVFHATVNTSRARARRRRATRGTASVAML